MAHKLVDNVRLRSIERLAMMANVLSGVEDFEGKSIQEFALREKPSYWSNPPACLGLEILRNISKLRNISARKPTVLLHLIKCLEIEGTSSSQIQAV